MTEQKIETKVLAEVQADSDKKPFEFEIDQRIPGALFLRANGKAEFFPQEKRGNKGGMQTTNKTDSFTIQESQQKVKITMTFEKGSLNFNKALKQVSNLVKTLQNMKLV